MAWLWSKKSRKLELPPEEEQRWSVAQAEHDGVVLVVRCNETAGEWAGHAELPVKLGFAIPLNRPNPGGLPNPAENAELGEVEDLIARLVPAAAVGVHALTLTTGETKELVFYIAPGADIAKLHDDIREQVASHDVQCLAVEDRKWRTYRAFAPGA